MTWPASAPPFLLGVATSGHQVDGNDPPAPNDWTLWEEAGRTQDPSGRAADHWHRFAEDVALFRLLGANAYRFSLEWSRLEPAPGRFDEEAVAHYREMVATCRREGVEPLATMSHFTLPTWLHGGWLSPLAAPRFQALAERLARSLDGVQFWCTINEPNVLALMGYVEGTWPPGQHRLGAARRVLLAQLDAHRRAYAAIKEVRPRAMVGIAHSLVHFRPARSTWWDRQAAALADRIFNQWPIRRAGPQDFIGVNYYAPRWVSAKTFGRPALTGPTPGPTTDMGWSIDPEGFRQVLAAASRWERPILVTENGIATDDESERAAYIEQHRAALERAQTEGADIRGYFYWSGLDNFEWVEGYRPHFGLIAVDRRTQARTIKAGAAAFAAWAAAILPAAPPRLPR